MSNAQQLRNWYTQVWEKGDLDAISTYFDPETLANGVVPEMQMGVDDFRELVMAFQAHVGKFSIHLPKIIEEGDWLSSIVIVRTSRADTGAPVEVTGQVMTRFKDGKIVEAYNHFDYISLLEQMGMLPADTMPICMTGQRLDWLH